MSVIPVSIKPSDSDKQLIESEVHKAIEKLGPGIDTLQIGLDEIAAEWHGVKHKGSKKASKEAEFASLSEHTKDGPVILYLHGGGYMMGSSDTHKAISYPIAKMCGGRVFSLNYRLAPQHPFPSALVDAILAYKYLIDPPVGALHKPIDPTKIVIAGDSAGVLHRLTSVLI
jgi:acetyl esterase/lipase